MSWAYRANGIGEVAGAVATGWYCMDCKIKADYDHLTHKVYCFKCGNEWPARFLAANTKNAKCQSRTTLYVNAPDYKTLVKSLEGKRVIYRESSEVPKITKLEFLKWVREWWPIEYEANK